MHPRTRSDRATIGCTCAECQGIRQRAKVLAAMRESGRGWIVKGEEAQRAIRKVRAFHARGMTFHQMSQNSGVATSKLSEMSSGRRYDRGIMHPVETMHRPTFNAIMRLEFGPASPTGRVSPVAPRRMLQALHYEGFPFPFVGEMTAFNYKNLGIFVNGHTGVHFITRAKADAIAEVYEKLRGVDPLDMGIPPRSMKLAMKAARANGFAPRDCWDADTIHDPDAFPEWTGACGTAEGYRIHKREGHLFEVHGSHTVFACDPCRKANAIHRAEEKIIAKGKVQAAGLLREGRTIEEIVDLLGIHPRTVMRARKMLDGDPSEELEEEA